MDNFLAFPYTGLGTTGMDLRDYFAAKIMLGLMREFHDDLDWNAHENADMAYQIADAMIKAREAK
jgi:hypothetical protein